MSIIPLTIRLFTTGAYEPRREGRKKRAYLNRNVSRFFGANVRMLNSW